MPSGRFGFIICKGNGGCGQVIGRTLLINKMNDHDRENSLYDLQLSPALADFFRVLGDPTRTRLISVLLEREICVTELASHLQMTQSAVSHQLNILKAHKMVVQRRNGKQMFYSAANQSIRAIMETGLEYLAENAEKRC